MASVSDLLARARAIEVGLAKVGYPYPSVKEILNAPPASYRSRFAGTTSHSSLSTQSTVSSEVAGASASSLLGRAVVPATYAPPKSKAAAILATHTVSGLLGSGHGISHGGGPSRAKMRSELESVPYDGEVSEGGEEDSLGDASGNEDTETKKPRASRKPTKQDSTEKGRNTRESKETKTNKKNKKKKKGETKKPATKKPRKKKRSSARKPAGQDSTDEEDSEEEEDAEEDDGDAVQPKKPRKPKSFSKTLNPEDQRAKIKADRSAVSKVLDLSPFQPTTGPPSQDVKEISAMSTTLENELIRFWGIKEDKDLPVGVSGASSSSSDASVIVSEGKGSDSAASAILHLSYERIRHLVQFMVQHVVIWDGRNGDSSFIRVGENYASFVALFKKLPKFMLPLDPNYIPTRKAIVSVINGLIRRDSGQFKAPQHQVVKGDVVLGARLSDMARRLLEATSSTSPALSGSSS